ncbi:hypothetical protein C5S31_08005 [ANME-1 cluster archaeon GoMg2]|nr:hypothetical protein [ANME-1 cluster archaeon GoMg2]
MKTKTIGMLLIAGLVMLSAMMVFVGTAAAETFTETLLYSDDPQQSNEVTFEYTEETTTGPGNSLLYTEQKGVKQWCYNRPWWKPLKQRDAVYNHNFDVTNLYKIYSAQITIRAWDVNSWILNEKPEVYVNGNYIGDLEGYALITTDTTLSIDSSYINTGTNTIRIVSANSGYSCWIVGSKLEIDYDTEESIPEFATIAIPAVSVLGLFLYFNRRKQRKE